jgi:hypothetical protein
MIKEIGEIQALLPFLGLASTLLEDTNVKNAGTAVGKVLNNVVKWSANTTADYVHTLINRGFTREEAIQLTITAKQNFIENLKSGQKVRNK